MSPIFDYSSQYDLNQSPYQSVNNIAWPAGHSMDWHSHPYLQFIQVMEGKLEVDWGQGWQSVKSDQLHILPPGYQHRLRSSTGHKQFGINFHSKHDERGLLKRLLEQFTEPCIIDNSNPPLDRIYHIDKLVQLAAIDLYCSLIASSKEHEPNQRDMFLAVVRRHLKEPSDVELWASELAMSRASAQRHCHRIFNCGLAELHFEQRMRHCADYLLANTDSIESVADEYGFADSTCLGRSFKRLFKMTPTQWRKRARQRSA